MKHHRPEVKWQKDFYDHIIRNSDDLSTQAAYVIENPIRKELVSKWEAYPYTGSIGINLDDVLTGIL